MTKEFPREVKIDIYLFIDICRLINCNDELAPEEKKALEKRISEQLDIKIDKLISHALYTKYKKSITEEERNQALKDFLANRQTPA